MTTRKTTQVAFWAVLGALAVVGLVYIARGLANGLEESNVTNIVAWGLNIALYIFFVGVSAGPSSSPRSRTSSA